MQNRNNQNKQYREKHMGAKVFISWSGELSKALGETVRDWIPKVLQSVKPYFTPDDIEKGTRWAREIEHELSSSQLGIICLTQDNQHSPWILFEAGALSKNLEESKVCPILFNFDSTDLIGPLSSFQATRFNKEDFKKLIESINNSCNDTKLEQKGLDETFDMWWPKLDEKIRGILAQEKSITKPKKRAERDILEEILEIARSNAKLLLPNQRGISRLTAGELVLCYKRIKEKISQGRSIEWDLDIMGHNIERMCRETGIEEAFVGRMGIRSYLREADLFREKNSVGDMSPVMKKRNREDDNGDVAVQEGK